MAGTSHLEPSKSQSRPFVLLHMQGGPSCIWVPIEDSTIGLPSTTWNEFRSWVWTVETAILLVEHGLLSKREWKRQKSQWNIVLCMSRPELITWSLWWSRWTTPCHFHPPNNSIVTESNLTIIQTNTQSSSNTFKRRVYSDNRWFPSFSKARRGSCSPSRKSIATFSKLVESGKVISLVIDWISFDVPLHSNTFWYSILKAVKSSGWVTSRRLFGTWVSSNTLKKSYLPSRFGDIWKVQVRCSNTPSYGSKLPTILINFWISKLGRFWVIFNSLLPIYFFNVIS